MKKSVMILSFMMACIMMCCLLTTKGTNKLVRASARTINNNQTIIVVGKGEIEVEPDSIQINFGLKTRADSLQSGQAKIKESFDNVVSKLKQLDDKSSVSVCYSSSYPVSEGGLLAYEFDCCLTAKSSKVDKANDIVDTIISAGATSVHNTSYTLLDREESYVKALVKARDNADQKVKAMYSDAKLVGLREETCYSCCESSRGENIKVCARVKAFYEVGSLNQSASTASQTSSDVSQKSNTNDRNSTTNNVVTNSNKNDEKIKENLNKNSEEKQNISNNENQKESLNNGSIAQTTNSQNSLDNNKKIEDKKEQNIEKTEEIKEDKQTENTSVKDLENNNKNFTKNENNEEDSSNKNNISTNTFNQEKNDAVNVLNDSRTTQNQNKKSNKINANNLIVKADKTLARNDDISLNEDYKEIA